MIYDRVCTHCAGDAVVDDLHTMHGCSGLELFWQQHAALIPQRLTLGCLSLLCTAACEFSAVL